MNVRVSELTELALNILKYQMYDRNGTPTDTLSQLIEINSTQNATSPTSEEAPKASSKRKDSTAATFEDMLDQTAFMDDFEIPDVYSVLEDPNRYVQTQMESFMATLDERIMYTTPMVRYKKSATCMRDRNRKSFLQELANFGTSVRKSCHAPMVKIDEEIAAEWSLTESEKVEQRKQKINELLEDFNMLLQLLKVVLDDAPDDWKELDRLLILVQTAYLSLDRIN